MKCPEFVCIILRFPLHLEFILCSIAEWFMSVIVERVGVDSCWFRMLGIPILICEWIMFIITEILNVLDPEECWKRTPDIIELPKDSNKETISRLCERVSFTMQKAMGQTRFEAIELLEFYCQYGTCFVWTKDGSDVHSPDADMELLFPFCRGVKTH